MNGTVRAQAYAGGSVMEAAAPLLLSALEAWRLQYFGVSTNTAAAADDADPDNDGLTNLVEFAFGLSPVNGARPALPQITNANGSFTATFTAPEDRGNVVYGAEWSATMDAGTWVAIPDTGTAPVHSFSAPAAPRMFVRYSVGLR